MNRRRLLRTLGTTPTIGVAGCAGMPGLPDSGDADDGYTPTPTETPTATRTPGDTAAPVIDAFTAQHTDTAGEIAVYLEGHDDEQIETARITTGTDDLSRHPGKPTITVDTRMHGEPGRINDVTGNLTDKAGNTTEDTVDAYVRKYARIREDDLRLDIGAVYISQAGDGFRRCIDRDGDTIPAVGRYGETPIPTDISTKHIDQMTGHGITRLVYDYAGKRVDEERIEALLESELIKEGSIEPFYTILPFHRNMDKRWKETIFPRDLPFLRDTLLSAENTATYDGRPVVSTWNFIHFAQPDSEAREKVMKEFGSYEQFVDEMRSHLRVDGVDPFLIIGKGSITELDDTEWGALCRQFDGMTTWFPGRVMESGKTTSWEEVYDDVEETFQATRQFALENDMEFIPMAFPGYDERENTCYGKDRVIPRSKDHFRQMLELAEEYSTTDQINIASFNSWVEGHAIEPGIFRGEDHGEEFLEVVKSFQHL